MAQHDIRHREDVGLLVRTFYDKVRADDMLGPIFNEVVKDWEAHFETLTDFWESNLFIVHKYNGNPMLEHVAVDQKMDGIIEQTHFQQWLKLWHLTIDELFVGDIAYQAKNRARKMSTFLFIKIFEARQP